MSRKMHIIIVDDKESITDLFESFISILDISCDLHCFNDPYAALKYVRSQTVDVIITDYNMPGINGLDLLKEASSSTVKIMISGYVTDFAEEQLASINALFFEKPVPMKEIGRIICEKAASLLHSD